jgi:hypothetical protein
MFATPHGIHTWTIGMYDRAALFGTGLTQRL